MNTAWLNLRGNVAERSDAFRLGLERVGFKIKNGATENPESGDIFVTWNRIGHANQVAEIFVKRGLPVLVTENSTLGNGFQGDKWLFLNRTLHNTSGLCAVGGPERWDGLNVDLQPWKVCDGETVILAQRGIGSAPVAMPKSWPSDALNRWGGRIRVHPGNKPHPIALAVDLENCGRAVTWSSGSAISALMMGIPVFSEAPNWVGQQDNTDEGRLEMFRRLAWNNWRLSEIASGDAFQWMLQ